MQKSVKKIIRQRFKENMPGFRSVDVFNAEYEIEPFIVFTEFYMDRPIFGPHPHAGISVMTYMHPDSHGSFLNRDSKGDKSLIEPGGIHVTQAGTGIFHEETPTKHGTACHGFQIWINHAAADRAAPPRSFHATSSEVPEHTADGVRVRVIQGAFEHTVSPMSLITKTDLLDVTLAPKHTLTLRAEAMAFLYMVSGEITIEQTDVTSPSTILFEASGDTVQVSATNQAANFIFATGKPHHEPLVYGGPFVMTTAAEMREAQQRLHSGAMGDLAPFNSAH
jgi:quercetin 2,3-dioxygenase